MLNYVLIGGGALVLLLVAQNIQTRINYRRVAPQLVLGMQKSRRLAGQVFSYRTLGPGESIPPDVAPFFHVAERELMAGGLTVLGDLMEVPPEGPSNPTRWFIDATRTICGWFGVMRLNSGSLKPVMLFFSEGGRDRFFISGRGSGAPGTAQPATNHYRIHEWDVAIAETVLSHHALIAESGISAIPQPATLEAGPALVSRLREGTARWRAAQPFHELLEQDVRALVGDKWKYVGPTMVRLMTADGAQS